MAEITIENVRKNYGSLEVLHGVSAKAEDGEFVVLVGPSGCGKSTLLRMVAGLETISSGTVRIGDRVVNDVTPKDRDVAMVFQNYALYRHMSVAKNMPFPPRFQEVSRQEIDAKVKRAAEILGLPGLLDRHPRGSCPAARGSVWQWGGPSSGTHWFFCSMDEPLSNLDAVAAAPGALAAAPEAAGVRVWEVMSRGRARWTG